MLNLIFRLNNKSVKLKQPDPPIIPAKGVTIIDWNRSESDAVNRYLNRLIRLQLDQYFLQKDEEKRVDGTAANRSLNRSRLDEKQLEDEPLVSVFDGFAKFTESVDLVCSATKNDKQDRPKRNHLACVEHLIEPDNLLFHLTLRNYFGAQFNQIKNRLLVIVYMNDVYFEKFLSILTGREFYFHLVIVTYSFSDQALRNVLRKQFDNFQSLDYLKIANASPNSLEIKTYDRKKYKEVAHELELVDL